MAKFLFIYRDGPQTDVQPSPEEMQQAMQVWMDWIEKGTQDGWLVEGGDALKPDGHIVHPDQTVTDGPFAESKELVSGYSIIQADNYSQAVEYAKTSPMISVHQGLVEVRELAEVGTEE
ncbi:MAG: YciI family protein [Planctomycetota bacterium]